MCGIAGILGDVTPGDTGVVEAMAAVLHHRGPDGTGVRQFPGAVLGHTRLAILDLSDNAAQPMVSDDGRHVLVFNGEIYNFAELRRELEGRHAFRGTGDSEVLLAAWREWGESCLDRLNGMFAFCVYDTEARSAFLARDRFGQKPLYYTLDGGRLMFASEIKGLLAAGVPAKPDRAVWLRYLALASYDDGEDTYFDGVRQLGPGRCARWDAASGLHLSSWYRLTETLRPFEGDERDAAAAIRDLMIDVGRIHMRSDVPVGVSLSGGFDSSALLAAIDSSGALHEGVKSFSVEFDGADSYSERPWIEAAANSHGIPLQIDRYAETDFRRDIVPLMWNSEGPLGGLMNCGRYHVMRMARAGGVTVMQDGTGLDEVFAGYRLHHSLYVGTLMQNGGAEADDAVGDFARNWSVSEDDARREGLNALDATSLRSIDGTMMTRLETLDVDARRDAGSLEPTTLTRKTGDPIKDSLLDYLLIRKIPRNNRFTDRMSMAFGIELRFPFLDHRLVELGLGLANRCYFLGGRSKSIVREAMKGLMDDSVRVAAKRTVHAPQGPWLRAEPMRSYVADLIASDSFADRGFFDVAQVRASFDEFCRGGVDNSFFVWQWINVEEWFRMFVDGDALSYRAPDDTFQQRAASGA